MVVYNERYFNAPQQRVMLAMPTTGAHVMGRGTGKSEGIGAPTLAHWANTLVRGAIGVVCRTFMQAADRTLPPLYAAWERMGYYRDIHYWVQRKPDKRLGIPRPYYAPDNDEHAIYWYTGSYFSIISQDRAGSANGKTLDAIYGDEAKLLHKKRYDNEIDKASRGNVLPFADLSCHGGELFLTDMPTTPEAMWILARKADNDLMIRKGSEKFKMSDLLVLISHWQLHINKLIYKLHKTPADDKGARIRLNRLIRAAEIKINYLRMETTMFSEASSLENIHYIGEKKIRKWKRDDLDPIFQTQVLNRRLYVTENGFYPHLSLEHHTYDHYDYTKIDSAGGLWLPKGVLQGSMNDGEVRRNKPLDIAMDAGASINCLVVGQEHPEVYRYLKSFYVKRPKLIGDVVNAFCDYYSTHQEKTVNFFYDHTFTGKDGTRVYSYADEVTRILRSRGWSVNGFYLGQQPGHESRYRMWGMVMQEINPEVKPVRFHRENCAQLLIAVQCAGQIQGTKGVQKDKRPEKRSDVPQEEATHLTDAMDTLYIGKYRSNLGYQVPSLDMVGI